MVKVMLIRPSQVRWKNEAKRIGAPIGILSLASILRENNVEVNVIDSAVEGYGQEREIKKDLFEYGLSNIEIEKRISNFNPDFVGINATHTSYWNQQKSIAKLVKKINPRVKVLIGGHYASGSASYITENVREIDHIFIGESESTLLKFIKLGGPKIIYGQEEKLTSLPNPAFNLIHSENYLPQMSHFGKPKGNNFITNVITRGCPSACDYCTSSYYFGRKVRHYSLEQIAQQLQTLKERGFEEYVSQDDNVLSLPSDFRREFFKLLKNSNMHWNLDGGLYYPKTTPELIEELAENNCYRVFLPVENPDIELMHGYHKYKSLKTQKEQREKLEKVINNLNNAGIEFYSAIMIGFPNETWESVKNTVDYAEQIKDAGAIGVGFHWVHPYPFTPFYDKQYQLVRPNKKWENSPEHYTFIKPVFPIENISLEKAEEYVNERAHKINRTAINNNSCQYK